MTYGETQLAGGVELGAQPVKTICTVPPVGPARNMPAGDIRSITDCCISNLFSRNVHRHRRGVHHKRVGSVSSAHYEWSEGATAEVAVTDL